MRTQRAEKLFALMIGVFGAALFILWFIYNGIATNRINMLMRENMMLTVEGLTSSIAEELLEMKADSSVIASSPYVQAFLTETDSLLYYEKAPAAAEIINRAIYPSSSEYIVFTFNESGNYYRFTGNLSNSACESLINEYNAGGLSFTIDELDNHLYFCHANPVVVIDGQRAKYIGAIFILHSLSQLEKAIDANNTADYINYYIVQNEEIFFPNNSQFFNISTLEETARIIGEYPVEDTPLSIVAAIDKTYVNAEERAFYIISGCMLILLVSMVIVLYRLLTRYTIMPIVGAKDQMEKGLLATQIDAHFVVNTITNIEALSKAGENEKCEKVAGNLGEILKHLHSSGETANVFKELEAVKQYVDIMNIVHNNKYEVVYDIDDELMEYIMPVQIMQPVVENAITHGLKNKEGHCSLNIYAGISGGSMEIIISDNGSGIESAVLSQLKERLDNPFEEDIRRTGLEGIALENISKRLRVNYGKNYGLSIESEKGRGTRLTIVLPLVADENL
ncbi:histidine kinase [Tyzzerella sp. OttesenSCG-928-J15]|nr:histidine kinase [Tyzzerella sp. OttesenSCG-928-J15]